VYIQLGKQVSAQLQFIWKGGERNTGTTLEIESMNNGAYRVIAFAASIATAGLLYMI
jgi:hypothetical protein